MGTVLAAAIHLRMAFIDGSALNVALPRSSRFKMPAVRSFWDQCLSVNAGRSDPGRRVASDQIGRKKVFMVGISLFMFASLACGWPPCSG
jgi:hypothetical protein